MIIKRYLVKDMNEAMVRIRYELGGDAIIVSKRWVRQKGFMNFFKKKVLEVTAAADQSKIPKNSTVQETQSPNLQRENQPQEQASKNSGFEGELQELKQMVYKLMENKEVPQQEDTGYSIDILEEMELDRKIIEDFMEYCKEKNILPSDLNQDILYQYLENEVIKNMNLQSEIDEKIWVFVGPTGVGKTTTIAKMAARESLRKGKKVGLITIDTYRIGAVEQLRTYANILGIPLEVVVTRDDLIKSVERLKDCDLILIDSTGRSSLNHEQLKEMKDFLDEIENKRNILVVSVTTRNKDLKSIVENYKAIGYEYVIVTKMDETQSYGSILNISCYTDKPISYITTGQNVPDDLEEASKERLFKYIWGEVDV